MNKTDTTQPSPTETDASGLPEHLRIKPEPKATRGEKITHIFAHWIINFVGNLALSIAITDLFMGYTPREKQAEKILGNKDGKAVTVGGKTHTPHYEKYKIGDGPEKQRLVGITPEGGVRIGITREPPPVVTSYFAEKFSFLRGASDGCRKLYDGMKSGVFNLSHKTLGAGHKVSETVSDIFSDIFTLMLGGHITTSLATYVLNRSDKWSRRFDKLADSVTGTKPGEEELAAREARYEHLAAQPKQGAGTIIKSRVLGFAMNNVMWSLVAANVDPRRYKPGGTDLMELKGQRLGIRGLTQHFGNKMSDSKIEKTPAMSDVAQNRWKYWSELGLFEAACTANTTVAHMIMTGLGLKKKPAPVVAEAKPAATAPADISSAPTSRSDEATAPGKTAEKNTAWSDKKVSEREEVKPREAVKPAEERRKESAGEALMATA